MAFKAYYNRDWQASENSNTGASISKDGNAIYNDKNYAETYQSAFRQAYLNVKGLFMRFVIIVFLFNLINVI